MISQLFFLPLARRTFHVALTAALLVVARPVMAQSGEGIAIGTTAPAVTVADASGRTVRVAPTIGRPMLIEFWATWCPNCKELEPALIEAARKYGAKVKFIGVAVSVNENPARVKAFVAKHGLLGDQYFDTHGDASGAYDAPATSYVVVIDKTGKVVYTGLGGKQDLEAAIKKVL